MLEMQQNWVTTARVLQDKEPLHQHPTFKLQWESSVGYWMNPIRQDGRNITVPITMEGKVALVLVDTGASHSCLSATFYNQHMCPLGGLHHTSPVQGVGGTELSLAGETGQLHLQWKGRALQTSLIVLWGLAGVDGILGMDILKSLSKSWPT